jgi:hypothetical protein
VIKRRGTRNGKGKEGRDYRRGKAVDGREEGGGASMGWSNCVYERRGTRYGIGARKKKKEGGTEERRRKRRRMEG